MWVLLDARRDGRILFSPMEKLFGCNSRRRAAYRPYPQLQHGIEPDDRYGGTADASPESHQISAVWAGAIRWRTWFDGYFPAPVGKLPTSYDTSFAMAIGGGLDVAVSRHVWIRALEADYYYSELRNVQGDRQNQFRLGAGIVFRGAGK
jgi:hypothetical protein